jgi:hypothetical protein
LYELDRKPRAVGKAYKQLIADWRELLPTQRVCLRLPLVPPDEYDDHWAQRERATAERKNRDPRTEPANADLAGGS